MTPRRAFTLIEMVATMTLVTVLAAVAAPLIATGAENYAASVTRAELSTAASAALERVVLEVREIPLDPVAGGASPDIDSLTGESIAWSGTSTIFFSAGSLRLSIAGEPARVLLDHVSSFELHAFDESGSAMAASLSGAACDPIRRIELTLTATRGGVSETIRTRVFLRSTMAGGSL